jgi:hypothetical protein
LEIFPGRSIVGDGERGSIETEKEDIVDAVIPAIIRKLSAHSAETSASRIHSLNGMTYLLVVEAHWYLL